MSPLLSMLVLIQSIWTEPEIVLYDQDLNELAYSKWASNRDEVAKLMPELERLITSIGKKTTDLEKIVVVNGIGGFSSTRIGVTVANTLAIITGAGLYVWTIEKDQERPDLRSEFAKSWPNQMHHVPIAEPIYDSAPMISPSKKKQFN